MLAELGVSGTIGGEGGTVPFRDLLALLDAVALTCSLRGAAESLGLSYRGAWGRALAYEEQLGLKLVVKTKGHGTALSPTGLKMREALRAAVAALDGPVAAAQARLRADLARLPSASVQPLRVAASHDPVLLECAQAVACVVELSVRGSADAIARLRAGTADAAGFHDGSLDGEEQARSLKELGFEIVRLFRREQGLMLRPGNPCRVTSIADLAAAQARFVNRQPGSGTRAWFDRLLVDAGLRPSDIRGYGLEEFTHQAVAALVASGGADAGMGVRAAAERFGLDFVPLGWESYFLAGQPGDARFGQLIEDAASRVQQAPGYKAA
jgi:molybdate-binding protein/molybdenum-dependent DNA-binding transcriptional regulator ModE